MSTGSQAHFHMETLTALAVPQENDEMIIYATTQNASALQVCFFKKRKKKEKEGKRMR